MSGNDGHLRVRHASAREARWTQADRTRRRSVLQPDPRCLATGSVLGGLRLHAGLWRTGQQLPLVSAVAAPLKALLLCLYLASVDSGD